MLSNETVNAPASQWYLHSCGLDRSWSPLSLRQRTKGVETETRPSKNGFESTTLAFYLKVFCLSTMTSFFPHRTQKRNFKECFLSHALSRIGGRGVFVFHRRNKVLNCPFKSSESFFFLMNQMLVSQALKSATSSMTPISIFLCVC